MNEKVILKKTEDFILKQFESDSSGHDFWHLQRVVNTAKSIQENEGGDLFLIELSAWLHDLGDYKLNDGKDVSVHKINEFLLSLGVGDATIKLVIQIVSEVSYKGGFNQSPTSLEAKIVQDADRLDAIGAIGIARTFAYGGKKGRVLYNPNIDPVAHTSFDSYQHSVQPTINHFYEKLLKLKDLMQTKTGRQLANKRHEFMEQYLTQFYSELS